MIKVTKCYPINPDYQAVAEIDGHEIILYIEKKKHLLFGLIEYFDRVSPVKMFLLNNSDGRAEDEHIFVHGILQVVRTLRVNMDTFNLKTEINQLYKDYWESVCRDKVRDKKLQTIIDKL